MYIVSWIIVGVIAGIAEALTAALVSIWIVIGAAVGCVAAICGAPLWLQIALALVSCGGSFVGIRKYMLKHDNAKEALALDNFVGNVESKRGTVSQKISPAQNGQVCIGGDYWSARALDDNATIEEGTVVVVYKIDGNCCIVAPLEN